MPLCCLCCCSIPSKLPQRTHENSISRPLALSGRLDSLRPATELHVLDVAEGGVNVLHCQEVLVDLVNLFEVHVCLLEVCECEVEQRALVEDPRHGSLVQLPRLVQPLLA